MGCFISVVIDIFIYMSNSINRATTALVTSLFPVTVLKLILSPRSSSSGVVNTRVTYNWSAAFDTPYVLVTPFITIFTEAVPVAVLTVSPMRITRPGAIMIYPHQEWSLPEDLSPKDHS